MDERYHEGSRELQDRFDTRRLADRLDERTSRDHLTPEDRAFIERMDMFFLATSDRDGQPQCSYKGGAPGFVRVLDEHTLAFPNYDGNGMFLSWGNTLVNPQVGLLFIDFVASARRACASRAPRRSATTTSCSETGPRRSSSSACRRSACSQLPALHPPHGARRAILLRPARRGRDADSRVEARRARHRRAARGRPGRAGWGARHVARRSPRPHQPALPRRASPRSASSARSISRSTQPGGST